MNKIYGLKLLVLGSFLTGCGYTLLLTHIFSKNNKNYVKIKSQSE